MSTAPFKHLRWRCRRGMRELDLILGNYLERHGADMSAADAAAFARLLDSSDDDLYDWLVQGRRPADPDRAALVTRIVAAHTAVGAHGT